MHNLVLLIIFVLVEAKLVSCQQHPMLSIIVILRLQVTFRSILFDLLSYIDIFIAPESLKYDLGS